MSIEYETLNIVLILSCVDNPYITIGYYTVNPKCDIYYIVSNNAAQCTSEQSNETALLLAVELCVVHFNSHTARTLSRGNVAMRTAAT